MPSLQTLQRKLAEARFFAVSLVLHLALVLVFGGRVLFRQNFAPPDFVSDPAILMSAEEIAPPAAFGPTSLEQAIPSLDAGDLHLPAP